VPLKDGSLRERWETDSAPRDRGENDDEERKKEREPEEVEVHFAAFVLFFLGAPDPLSYGAGKLIMRSTD
jgi:hypothetical protein